MILAGQPTFDSIDRIPWSSLHHAYGRADDVPDQIRALLHPDPKVRQDVLYAFTCNIFHQGSVYPATVAAIPLFVELVRYEGVENREGILDLLASLAVGYPDEHSASVKLSVLVASANPLRSITQPKEFSWMHRDPEYLIEEGIIKRECYAEVAAGCPVYVELLSHEDSRVAIAASFLLAFFPLHAFGAGSTLLETARSESRHELVRGSAMISLSYLHGGNVRGSFFEDCAKMVLDWEATADQPLPFMVACAALCLLRDRERDGDADVHDQLQRIGETCVVHGIKEPVSDFYRAATIPDKINTSEEYYDAFLAPEPQFPWSVESQIKQHIRKFLKKSM